MTGPGKTRREALAVLASLAVAGCRRPAKGVPDGVTRSVHGDLVVYRVEVRIGPNFTENTFILADARTSQAWIVDPGAEAGRIASVVEALGLSVRRIVATHGHYDHTGAVAELASRLRAPFAMHAGDLPWLDRNAASDIETPGVDERLEHGATLPLGPLSARLLATPGHSEGSVCLYFEREQVLVAGDTLFRHGVGRTDLPGGSARVQARSLAEQLAPLPDDVVVLPGHDERTTIGEERRYNGWRARG